MANTQTKIGPPSALSEFWFYFSRNTGAVIGLVVFVIVLVLAIAAPLSKV